LITNLSDTSPLKLIDLQQGDMVNNINGQPVNSAEELARTLAAPIAADVSVIRIGRYRDGRFAPIYLQLQ
jgi:S1-C subfamily serine protease